MAFLRKIRQLYAKFIFLIKFGHSQIFENMGRYLSTHGVSFDKTEQLQSLKSHKDSAPVPFDRMVLALIYGPELRCYS